MFIPKVNVSMIDPEANVRFIQNYLSREKAENSTRPFYEKTISLYPELENILNIEDEKKRGEDFDDIGAAFEAEHEVKKATIGAATLRLMDQRELVDFAIKWIEKNRR